MLKRPASKEAEIPTSSMADITFLLLLFFLVTTTIDVDTGIGLVLPQPPDPSIPPVPVKPENMLKVLVNASGEVLINDELSSVAQIHDIAKNRIASNEKLIVSIKVDRDTPYRVFISTLDEIKLAYQELREEYALKIYNTELKQLTKEQLQEVREKIPQRISIAEPEQR